MRKPPPAAHHDDADADLGLVTQTKAEEEVRVRPSALQLGVLEELSYRGRRLNLFHTIGCFTGKPWRYSRACCLHSLGC
jgi:hypothetical protein